MCQEQMFFVTLVQLCVNMVVWCFACPYLYMFYIVCITIVLYKCELSLLSVSPIKLFDILNLYQTNSLFILWSLLKGPFCTIH